MALGLGGLDGLADDFIATLPDGTTAAVDDLRAGTVTPIDLGFGVTERELIATRRDHLALLRVEDARWSIEEIDEGDRLLRVRLFDDERLDEALAELAHITGEPVALVDRQRPDSAHPPIS